MSTDLIPKTRQNTHVSRISIGRVYNLGNYENIRYEITVDVPDGEDATAALKNLEGIIAALSPEGFSERYERERALRTISTFEATPVEERTDWQAEQVVEARSKLAKDDLLIKRRAAAREALKAFGGSEFFKDAKQEWDDNEFFKDAKREWDDNEQDNDF